MGNCKTHDQGKTISYASFKKKEREKQEAEIKHNLGKLYEKRLNNDVMREIEEKELELQQIRTEKVKGILLRAKSRWKVECEKSTRYFCNLEKRHYTEKNMSKIITEDGVENTQIKDILHEQKQFYEKLYCYGSEYPKTQAKIKQTQNINLTI